MIKIVKGIYGYLDKNGNVKPKTSEDAPFTLTDAQEKRLVDLGVAEYVNVSVDEGYELVETDESTEIPSYSVKSKADELREIADKYMNLEFPKNATKTEMVDAMDAYLESDSDAMPTFDATEAVE